METELEKLKRNMVHLQIQNAQLEQQLQLANGAAASIPAAAVDAPARPAPKPAVVDPSQLDTQVDAAMDSEVPPTQPSPSEVPEDEGIDGEDYDEEEMDLPEEGKPSRTKGQDEDEEEAAIDSDSEKAAELEELEDDEKAAKQAIEDMKRHLEEIRAKRAAASSSKSGDAELSSQELISRALQKKANINFDELSLASTAKRPVTGPGSGSNQVPAIMFGVATGQAPEGEIDTSKVNTSTHKKEWNQLDRLMSGPRGANFPHMRQLFNGKQGDP